MLLSDADDGRVRQRGSVWEGGRGGERMNESELEGGGACSKGLRTRTRARKDALDKALRKRVTGDGT